MLTGFLKKLYHLAMIILSVAGAIFAYQQLLINEAQVDILTSQIKIMDNQNSILGIQTKLAGLKTPPAITTTNSGLTYTFTIISGGSTLTDISAMYSGIFMYHSNCNERLTNATGKSPSKQNIVLLNKLYGKRVTENGAQISSAFAKYIRAATGTDLPQKDPDPWELLKNDPNIRNLGTPVLKYDVGDIFEDIRILESEINNSLKPDDICVKLLEYIDFSISGINSSGEITKFYIRANYIDGLSVKGLSSGIQEKNSIFSKINSTECQINSIDNTDIFREYFSRGKYKC